MSQRNPTSKPQRADRRRFMRESLRTAVAVGSVATVLGLQSNQSKATPGSGIPVRPPGALDEPEFLNACLRCGLCVQACPYDTLKLP